MQRLAICPCGSYGSPRWVGPDPLPMCANFGIMFRTCGNRFICPYCAGHPFVKSHDVMYCYKCASSRSANEQWVVTPLAPESWAVVYI